MGETIGAGDPRGSVVRPPVRLIAIVIFALAAVAIASFPTPTPPPSPRGLRTAVLTPDGADVYAYRSGAGRMVVRAPATNVNSNLRTLFWRAESPIERDATTCATWADATDDLAQQGAALRIWHRGNRVRALTVTKNVFSGVFWAFKVHVWDSATGRIDERGAFDLGEEFSYRGATQFGVSLPWRMCARTRGDRLEFKVWRLTRPEPRWGTPGLGGTMAIPDDTARRGRVGWYIGHLRPGVRATFTDLGYGPAPGPPVLPTPADVESIEDLRDAG